jgi:hypothetical protein
VITIASFIAGLGVMYGVFVLAAWVGRRQDARDDARAEDHYRKTEERMDEMSRQYAELSRHNDRQAEALESLAYYARLAWERQS